jgi:hypothetical protein
MSKKCLNCEEELVGRQEKYCSRKCKEKYRHIDIDIKERISKYTKGYRKKNKKRIREYDKRYKQRNKKELLEYNKEYGKEYRKEHKREAFIYNKKYRRENDEILRKKDKEYQQKNKKILNIKNKLRRQKNIEIFREKGRKYYQNNKIKIVNKLNERYKKDFLFRLSCNISSSMRSSLRSKNLSKNGRHWEDIVGYRVQDLKEHLEKLFVDGMNWEKLLNGEIHIDHIVPKIFFEYKSVEDVEFKYCWSLDNLQPLWAKDNLEKNAKVNIIVLISD